MKNWVMRPKSLGSTKLSTSLGVPPLVVELLEQRGLNFDEMNTFIEPGLRHLLPPSEWPGLEDVAQFLLQQVLAEEPVLVWGDYDVDGITGTTLAVEVLRFHGVKVSSHLPERKVGGYGLHIPTMEALVNESKPGVLLTVDCGISDVDAVIRAKELGFKVVITDHHLPGEVLPPADRISNPRIGVSPCPHLAGVGVIFFLMATLNSLLAEHSGKRLDMREVLDLVALGTLADMVALTGQNRILVKNGLLKIAEAKRLGLAALKDVSGFSSAATLSAGQVVFNLAPRINAAGRLGNPGLAGTMLSSSCPTETRDLAKNLDDLNAQRRSEEQDIFEEAMVQAKQNPGPGLVLYGQNWHQGIIGIVASRIVEAVYCPVLILCDHDGQLKGSGRSIPEFDLHAGLSQCSDLLLSFGGHKQAVGLRLEQTQLEALRQRFASVVQAALGKEPLIPTLKIDAELDFMQASDFTLLKALDSLQPFGIGNPEPVFSSLPLTIRKYKVFGHNREHVSLEVTEEASGISLQAKAWRMGTQFPPSLQGHRIRLAYTPIINAYRGTAGIELKIKDFKILS